VEKNGKIQNEIHKRIGKVSEFYHLAMFGMYYYMEQRHGHVLRGK
jgi:hypothetical protein